MKKWLIIFSAFLLFVFLGARAEDKEILPDQSAPTETAAPLAAADKTAVEATVQSEKAVIADNTLAAQANDSKTLAELQNLQGKVETLQDKIVQLQKQTLQMHYLVMGLLGSVLLMAVLMLMLRRKKSLAHQPEPLIPLVEGVEKTVKIEDDTRGEYDFMGSSEGIPAKLDLARAYIAMEDFNAARQTLSEILGEGDATQRQEARALLKKMNPQ